MWTYRPSSEVTQTQSECHLLRIRCSREHASHECESRLRTSRRASNFAPPCVHIPRYSSDRLLDVAFHAAAPAPLTLAFRATTAALRAASPGSFERRTGPRRRNRRLIRARTIAAERLVRRAARSFRDPDCVAVLRRARGPARQRRVLLRVAE